MMLKKPNKNPKHKIKQTKIPKAHFETLFKRTLKLKRFPSTKYLFSFYFLPSAPELSNSFQIYSAVPESQGMADTLGARLSLNALPE